MRVISRFGAIAVVCLASAVGPGEREVRSQTPADNQSLNIVGRWWMPAFGDGDHMSTTSPVEQPAGNMEGQMFYLPELEQPGTQPLYRLFHPGLLDHMDSTIADESGYTTEAVLGYVFSSQFSGSCGLGRWFNAAVTDHMTGFCGEDPSGSGWLPDGYLGDGFPRHGNNCEVPVALQGAQVRLVSNLAAGGAVSELWWNGKQFINNWDYGRQLQIALNLTFPGEQDNPTEGGDRWGCNAAGTGPKPAGWAHGSPLLSYSNAGGTLRTTTSPLQWNPQNFGGGPDNPVRWLGTIAKELSLDFGSPNTIRWTTTITLPGLANYFDLEIVTAYLNNEFTQMYDYDAATEVSNPRSVPVGQCVGDVRPPSGSPAGGVIIATVDGNYALGLYHRDIDAFQNWFGLCNFLHGLGGGTYGPDTNKSNVRQWSPNPLQAGSYSFTAYVTVGTLETARSEMRRLYLSGF